MTDETPIDKLQRHMLLSQTIGAPVEHLPTHAIAVIELVVPYLAEHTTPREAGIVMATVYAYFAALLTSSTNDAEQSCRQAHDLLDVAIHILADLDLPDENDEKEGGN